MPVHRRFKQVNVFTQQPFKRNPLAVIMAADGLTDAQMPVWRHSCASSMSCLG